MKVLHILDHSVPLFSGYSFRSASIIKFQKALGVDTIVLTSPKHGSPSDVVEQIDGIQYYRTAALKRNLTHVPFFRETLLMHRLNRRIAEIAKTERIDLIHSHSPSLNGLPALRIARQLRIPFVYEARAFWEDAATDHGTFEANSPRYRISRALETYVFNKANAVIVIAEAMRREVMDRGIDSRAIMVVPNGVDVDCFQPRPRNIQLAGRLEVHCGPVFGFIGSFYRYEGLKFLLEAFPKILERVPTAKLLLIGGGRDEAALRALSQNARGAVIFTGQIPHSQIADYYSVIDIMVFPRYRMRLTDLVTPLKPLEAMAMGKAMVASDVGGHRELIEHGVTGLMFRADDPTSLIDEAVRAANDQSLREKLGKAGRRHVETERAWATIVSRYLPMYERLVQSSR